MILINIYSIEYACIEVSVHYRSQCIMPLYIYTYLYIYKYIYIYIYEIHEEDIGS